MSNIGLLLHNGNGEYQVPQEVDESDQESGEEDAVGSQCSACLSNQPDIPFDRPPIDQPFITSSPPPLINSWSLLPLCSLPLHVIHPHNYHGRQIRHSTQSPSHLQDQNIYQSLSLRQHSHHPFQQANLCHTNISNSTTF